MKGKMMRRAILLLISLTAGVGTTLVIGEACPLIPAITKKHHSNATLDKWAAWRKQHPNWKPKPQKPSDIDSKECIELMSHTYYAEIPLYADGPIAGSDEGYSILQQELELIPQSTDQLIESESLPIYDVGYVAQGDESVGGYILGYPVSLSPGYPVGVGSVPPTTPPIASTPEPDTFVMIGSGLFSFAFMRRMKCWLR